MGWILLVGVVLVAALVFYKARKRIGGASRDSGPLAQNAEHGYADLEANFRRRAQDNGPFGGGYRG